MVVLICYIFVFLFVQCRNNNPLVAQKTHVHNTTLHTLFCYRPAYSLILTKGVFSTVKRAHTKTFVPNTQLNHRPCPTQRCSAIERIYDQRQLHSGSTTAATQRSDPRSFDHKGKLTGHYVWDKMRRNAGKKTGPSCFSFAHTHQRPKRCCVSSLSDD